jgi:tetratricopeptide (TPR) repeat protein
MQTRRTIWPLAALAAVLLTVAAVYGNSLENGFHFDDFHTVTDNPAVRSLRNVPRFFTDATSFSVLPANRTYRPFVTLSLAVDYALGHGYVPFWFHLGTLLVFLLQLAAMWWLFERILRAVCAEHSSLPGWAAVAAAAWYGLHPAMAETVNYVIQRGDIYSTLGVVGALAIYVGKPRWRGTGLYLLPFVFGILSKPPAVVLPVLLFAYVFLFEEEGSGARWRRAAVAALPSLAVGVAAMVLQSAMTPKTFTPATISHFDYLVTQPFVLLRYFASFFLPLHLNVDTDFGVFDGVTGLALVGFGFVALVCVAIWASARRRALRPVSFGLLWFLVASAPTSLYTLSEVENDHRLYMPFVGLVLAVTWALVLAVQRLEAKRPAARRIAVVLGVVALAGYGYGVHARNKVWKDEESLWLDDVTKSPKNGRGLMIYGLTQMSQGAYPVALDYFTRALEYTPNYPTLEINLGVCYGAMGEVAPAQQHFERAIALAPRDDQPHFYYGRWLVETGQLADALPELRTAVALNPARIEPRDLLAQTLVQTGDVDAAVALAKETLALAPDDAAARALLANPAQAAAALSPVDALINASLQRYRAGDYAGTIAAAEAALKLDPRSALAYNNLGAGHAGLGEWAEAVAAEKQALVIQPDFSVAQNNLAAYAAHPGNEAAETPESLLNESLGLYRAGQYPASITAARRALALRPGYAEAWNNIAAGEAAMKHWDAAIAAADRAIALKPDFQLAKNNRAWAVAEKAKVGQ